jgi:hypothetical protein
MYGSSYRTIYRVAHTPKELKELLRLSAMADLYPLGDPNPLRNNCLKRSWIRHRNNYALVLPKVPRPACGLGKKCLPVHPRHPLWVSVGGKVGVVPRHPDDIKGKPPLNLKYGIIIPSAKPGEPVQHVVVDSSQKVKVLDKTPGEFQRNFLTHPLPVSAPEIRAHLMQEATRGQSIVAVNHADSHILYDYKSQKFMMPAAPVAGARPWQVQVGGITSNGRVTSFAEGRSADSFGRGSAAASYNGGAHNSGGSHGGGRGSESYSSGGGGSSGSHSSGSSSSGSSSHSSGGSSSGGSTSSPSSSSSSSSSTGARGRP